jgi:beta-glucosidase
MTPMSFPDGFLWGAATAGHQIEGGNVSSDFWAAEWAAGAHFAELSGDACDSYHRYAEDIALLAGAGLDTYRFSVEWARIEPDEGWYSRAELDHYRRMVGTCLEHGVTPMVTYNHFTTPFWFAQRGGWTSDGADDRFARYCERLTAHIGDLVPWACTLNEPNLMAMMAHVGFAPVGDGDADHPGPDAHARAETARLRELTLRTMPASLPAFQGAPVEAMARAHRRAVDAIRSGPGDAKVGWTLALVDYQPAEGGDERTALAREKGQLEWLDVSADDDFVGVQTYSRERIGPDGMVARPAEAPKMLTGWEVYPEALGHTVRMAAERAGVPVIVTENGCATADDAERIAYTEAALHGLAACIADGVDVAGYLHWSLLDNFEWASGFAITFGLIAVDRTTFERTPKPSLAWLGEVARSARNG